MVLELGISLTGEKYVRFSLAKGAQLVASHALAVVVSVTFGCGPLCSLRGTPKRDELPLEMLLHIC